ncbi:MAG: NAD-dependent epimerase/dehydratase family protein [Thermoplasmata archaeon]|jgi:UDP-glucose 4-epimerase
MVRVGVTGASGYIGGALVPFLAARHYDLRLIDNRTGPVEATYRDWPVERADFESDAGLALLSDSDVILHLAAVSGVMVCARDPTGSARSNVSGTSKLVDMCRARRIPLAFASSFAVVGAPKELPVRENTPTRPTHEYARQKAAGEELVAGLGREGVVPVAVARQSNVYAGYRAEGRYIAKGNVIQLFARQATEGRLTVNAPGTQRRDFVHLEDVVAHWEAIARYLLAPGSSRAPTTFNVASGEALSVLEVAELVRSEFARLRPTAAPVRVDVVPNPREGVELVEPGFAVDRAETGRKLGISCRFRVRDALPSIFRDVEELGKR